MPRCRKCLDQNRHGRNARALAARRAGTRLYHHDRFGRRYDTRNRWLVCTYCKKPFRALKLRSYSRPHCVRKRCGSAHRIYLESRRKERSVAVLADKPAYNRNRLRLRLKRLGRDLAWYDAHARCGICKATVPGGMGRWHLDHDHACCDAGCQKCFRGLLCHSCNVGLGQFRDDPTILRAAIAWVS